MKERFVRTLVFVGVICLMGIPVHVKADPCSELEQKIEDVREYKLKKYNEMQKNTILKNPKSITEELSCFDEFKSYVDIGKYSPESIMDILNGIMKNMAESACQMAKSALNQQMQQITGMVNQGGTLPYGLGNIYSFGLSTGGLNLNAKPNINTSVFNSKIPVPTGTKWW